MSEIGRSFEKGLKNPYGQLDHHLDMKYSVNLQLVVLHKNLHCKD